MAADKPKKPYWVDALHGKHECYSYDEPAVVRTTLNGRDIEVVVPSWFAGVEVFVAAEQGEMLFCFGRTADKFDERYCGLVMVAKKKSDVRYEVGVWHELYPWALTHFGFPNEMGG